VLYKYHPTIPVKS